MPLPVLCAVCFHVAFRVGVLLVLRRHVARMTLAGLEPAIFGSEDQRLIH